jgi:RNA polymerase sigma-70 factor (ECF subfamily)
LDIIEYMNLPPARPLATPKATSIQAPVATAVMTAPATAPAQQAADSLRFPSSLAIAVERCWREAAAPAAWILTRDEYQVALERSAAKRFPGAQPYAQKDTGKIEAYLDTLHARDLALAVACSKGSAAAWDFFMAEFRPDLYRAARAIVGQASGDDAAARELVDSLHAELYGLRESAAGRRKSLFEYFHGRSKLSTWLHAVLSQRHVDEIRRTRATEPLENVSGEVIAEAETPGAARPGNAASSEADPERANYLAALQVAMTAALGELDPRDRVRLAYYYADDHTLAEIGRLLGEHEATVSRKLDRTRRAVGARVEAWLREGKKWSEAQVRECLDCARGEWPFDLTAHLQPATTSNPGRETNAISSSAGERKI